MNTSTQHQQAMNNMDSLNSTVRELSEKLGTSETLTANANRQCEVMTSKNTRLQQVHVL